MKTKLYQKEECVVQRAGLSRGVSLTPPTYGLAFLDNRPLQRKIKIGELNASEIAQRQGIVQLAREPAWKLKANAKKMAAKKRKAAAQKKQDDRDWWLKVLFGGMLLSGAAIGAYKTFYGESSGATPKSGNNNSHDQGQFGNTTSSIVHQDFHRNETARLMEQRSALAKQPLSCPVIRDRDAIDIQIDQLHHMSKDDYLHKATSPLNPSQGKGHIVGMAGLPGSGKSVLQSGCTDLGYVGAKEFDDIGQNPKQLDQDYRWWNPFSWPRKLPPPIAKWPDQLAETSVKTHSAQGTNVVMSDPEFVKKSERDKTERTLGKSVEWAYFENNPEQAKDNAKFRKETATSDYDKSRNVEEELAKIDDLSSQYDLPKEAPVHPIVNARKKYRKKGK